MDLMNYEITTEDDSWMYHAPCRGMETEIFFCETRKTTKRYSEQTRYALKICSTCSFKNVCLETFINEQYGIFGGKTPHERERIRVYRKRNKNDNQQS